MFRLGEEGVSGIHKLHPLRHGRGEELQCLRAGLLKSKWCGRPIASALFWVGHSCGDHLIQPATDSQQFGRGFASGLNLHQKIKQGGGAGSTESLCHPFLRRVCGRDFGHNLRRVDFPALADERGDDALVSFGAGLVEVSEVGFHGYEQEILNEKAAECSIFFLNEEVIPDGSKAMTAISPSSKALGASAP